VKLDALSHLDEFNNRVWKLSDNERKSLHAGGVTYYYVGENVSFALDLINEAKRTHLEIGRCLAHFFLKNRSHLICNTLKCFLCF
jgi:hypothetical protein